MKITAHFTFLLLVSQLSFAQEQNYTRYDVDNGLAGSTVYSIIQDHDGYLWFGTETGVSRFDGTHFKNFGTEDGMPDNEILKIFQDSKGRIWMLPFKKTIFYYYRGVFHTAENDSLLQKIHTKSNVLDIAEDSKGNILLQEPDQLQLISGNQVVRIDSVNGNAIRNCNAISESATGGFLTLISSELYELKNQRFFHVISLNMPIVTYKFSSMNKFMIAIGHGQSIFVLHDLLTHNETRLPFEARPDNVQFIGDSLCIGNSQLGAEILHLKKTGPTKIFLKNKTVSRVFIDNENNYWFTTRGEGVFRLTSQNIISLSLSDEGRKLNAYCVNAKPNKWLVTADLMHAFVITHDSTSVPNVKMIWNEFGKNLSGRAIAIDDLGKDQYLLGSDLLIEKIPRRYLEVSGWSTAVKAIWRTSDSEALVATNSYVALASLYPLKLKDTFWNERATTVYTMHDTIFVGTLDGLYLVTKNKSKYFAGANDKLLRNRISSVRSSPNGVIWVATDGAGVLRYQNGRVMQVIDLKNGLSSNNCRTLWAGDDELWVGTDKGLNRIRLDTGISVVRISTIDGLSSNVINSVDLDNNIVVVATPEGINYFDKNQISNQSKCHLVLDKIVVSGRELNPESKSFSLRHDSNNIHFEYAGISFRSGGEMKYEYRLMGLDTNWKTTKENFLDYPSLPSGDYELQLRAINKFDKRSNLISIPFSIQKLLAEKNWFRALVLIVLLALVFLLVYWRTTRVRKREEEKNEIRRHVSELEQLALKSQMNPHFIFNCLNSIQQFVVDKDVAGSNKFITGFSRLIRQTLDFSARREISIAEEIKYISTYLELEQVRFEGKFQWQIKTSDVINVNEYYIPPMMLQPFVENSIRHGLRYRKDNNGMITIHFEKSDSELICIIEDNGIGRREALRLKSNNPIEYQSKGMSLIASRIEYLNRDSEHHISLSVEDLNDQNANCTGTRVVMGFPLQIAN